MVVALALVGDLANRIGVGPGFVMPTVVVVRARIERTHQPQRLKILDRLTCPTPGARRCARA